MQFLLESMRRRMSFTMSSSILKYHGIHGSNSWTGTIEKIVKEDHSSKKPALRNSLKEHNLCGNKYTKFYKIDALQADTIIENLQLPKIKSAAEGNAYINAYPNSLPSHILDTLTGELFLVEKISNDHGIGLVFSSTTKFTKREKINLASLVKDSPEAIDLMNQYQDVIGLKFQSVQLFSVIWVSRGSSVVETRIDLPDGMLTDIAHMMHSKLKAIINTWLNTPIENPINLYPLINKMYKDSNEGHVVDLAFSTTTASVKRERMRRDSLDLREEAYHEAGKAGLVTEIEPFRISIRWVQGFPEGTVEIATKPELTLAGTSKGSTGTGSKFDISAAGIKGCMGTADYHFVIDRIHHHLSEISDHENSA